jgi:hypothetical protein
MATGIENFSITLIAGADLSASDYLVGTINASGLAVKQTTAAAGGVGIIQAGDLATRSIKVMTSGISPAVYGDTVTLPANLTNDANGKLVPTTATTDKIVAVALEAGSADEVHSVLLVNASNGGLIRTVISIPLTLSAIADGNVASFVPGFAGTIVKAQFSTTVAASTAGKLTTLGFKIGSTAVTGGATALTTATVAANANIQGSAITANNAFEATDTITITAASTTAFVEGAGMLLLTIAQ